MGKPTRVTNRIRALRFDAGEMTQAELADRVGVTRQTVIAIEQGRYSPSLEMAFQIAQGVRCPARRRVPVSEGEVDERQSTILCGGTGRTGGRVLQQLLGRGVRVRAVVRSAERLPAGVADDPRLTVVEADLLSLSDDQVREQIDGCDVVISCLGHTISAQGVFGRPRDLVDPVGREGVPGGPGRCGPRSPCG